MLGSMLTIFAAVFFLIGLRGLYESYSNSRWPTTRGQVVNSGVSVLPDSAEPSFRFMLTYCYEVGAKKYRSDRYALIPVESSYRAIIEQLVDRHPVGSEITVHYSPLFPSSSLIQQGRSPWPWLFFAIGMIGLGFGSYLLSH